MRNQKTLYINTSVLIFGLLSICLGILEAFAYKGFVFKHVGISYNSIFVSAIFLSVLNVLLIMTQKTKFKQTIPVTILIFPFPVLFITYLLSRSIERVTFTNYIFSKFHLNFQLIILPLLISIYPFVTGLIGYKKSRGYIRSVLIIVILINLTGLVPKTLINKTWFVVTNMSMSNEEKMIITFGKSIYNYSEFVKANTPPDAVILVPPQDNPWPQTGNVGYFRYFLYPRKLINAEECPSISNDVTHILIDWGESEYAGNRTHGWPKCNLWGKNIVYMIGNDSIISKTKVYLYKDAIFDQNKRWGIIEL